MLKKIYAFYFMLLFFCNFSIFATLNYDIFNIKKNPNINWTDEDKNKLPIDFSVDDIATFKHVGNESYVLAVEKNCDNNDKGIKERVDINFKLNGLDNNIEIFAQDNITDNQLNIYVSEHDKTLNLFINNQDEYNIHFDRNPTHPVSIVFKPITLGESEDIDPIDLSFSIFEVKSQLMAPKKTSKNRRKRQRQREKRRLLKELASSQANIPVPPPLPPMVDVSTHKISQNMFRKEKKKADILKPIMSSIEFQEQFGNLKPVEEPALIPKKKDIPQKMFTSIEFQGQLGKLKPAKDRTLAPKTMDESDVNTNLFDALKNGLDSFRQKIKEDDPSDKTESYSTYSFQSTYNTCSGLSYTCVSTMKDDVEKYKKDDDTDNDEGEEFVKDEIDDFVFVEDDEIKKVQALKCTDCPKPIVHNDDDKEMIAVDLYGGGSQQNQTVYENTLDTMIFYPTEESSKDLSDHTESKKKTGLRGILKKAGTAKTKIVGILKNTKKEKPILTQENTSNNDVIIPRRLSVTHIRTIFETPSGSIAHSPVNAGPKRMLPERPRNLSITHLNSPFDEPKEKLSTRDIDDDKTLQKRTSVKDLKAMFEQESSQSLYVKPTLPRSVSFQNIKQIDDDTHLKKSSGVKRNFLIKSRLRKDFSKPIESQ